MVINLFSNYDFAVNKNIINNKKDNSFSNLAPLKCDTVSFGAMKKNQFNGIDLVAIEKFKAPIDKFNSKTDFDKWAKSHVDEILKKDYAGRNAEVIYQRKETLKEWKNYILHENGHYTNAEQLLVFDSITKNLKPDTNSLLPILNKGVIAEVISDMKNSLINKTTDDIKTFAHSLNLEKNYTKKLKSFVLDEGAFEENVTKWIVIPSKSNDPENFDLNVSKLQLLSCNSWCTKTTMAKPYLNSGDFHIYVENGKTKVAIRFLGDKISEIQGQLNNSKIPLDYADEVLKHIKEGKYKLAKIAKSEVDFTKKYKNLMQKLKDVIENNNNEDIFKYLGFKVKKDANNKLILSNYRQAFSDVSLADLGIDENVLFENVVEIEGDADFSKSALKSLNNIRKIGGDVIFSNSKIFDTGNLKEIGGDAYFANSYITTLGKINKIKGSLYAISKNNSNSFIELNDLSNLEIIGKDIYVENHYINKPSKLKTVGGDVCIINSRVSFDNLETIKGDVYFKNAKINSLANLKKIDGNAYFKNSIIDNYSDYIDYDDFGNKGYYITDRTAELFDNEYAIDDREDNNSVDNDDEYIDYENPESYGENDDFNFENDPYLQ